MRSRQTQGQTARQTAQVARVAQRSIRRRYAAGEVSLADLAEEYSVGRSTIHRVIHRAPAANAAEHTAPDQHSLP
ncbi:helix-turn-helix domain-containing protein [Amycolatopsis sp. NPDC023774]|uniref:helix-turn-helix domain-containing protein n=1 Tax=Amycolatopsis sp. NPDC023774 TaxID=3155015 RepID=UPI0033C5AB37